MEDFEYINKEFGTHYKGDNDISWDYLTMCKNLSEAFIERYRDRADWFNVSIYQKLSEGFIERHSGEVYWGGVSRYQRLSEGFMERHRDEVYWDLISRYQTLSEEFIEKHHGEVDWDYISRYQALSEGFIEKYQDKVDWRTVSMRQKLSEGFIERFQDRVNWSHVFTYQQLSERFIRDNIKERYWGKVLTYQRLSEGLIGDMLDGRTSCRLVGDSLNYQKLSDGFIKGRGLSVNKDDLWQYKSVEFKKRKLVDTGKYECHEDHFIAYKAIRDDRYSLYNFQYRYLPGGTYESTCDCTSESDSFGLNVGTYDFAKSYLDLRFGIIVKCKVYYKDIGRIVHKGEKVRCFKITVLD